MSTSVVREHLGAGTVRFHASPAARAGALPSYALAHEYAPPPDDEISCRVEPRFEIVGKRWSVALRIEPGTSLYGTGEVFGPLLRNGRRTVCWNTDAYAYGRRSPSLYQSHPWVLAVRADGSAWGAWADTTYRCEVDTGAADAREVRFTADGPAFPLVVIEGASPRDVLRELARLTGPMPMPPRWALGYHQCRYSYYPESRVREVAAEFRRRGIPCDAVWLDIDYMDGFRVFTFDPVRFPDPARLFADLRARGFRSVLMIDPGLKAASDAAAPNPNFDPILRHGDRADVWVKRRDGAPYEGPVWPGPCRFPDFTAPGVRRWWIDQHRALLALDPDGVWNDMNEPAVFSPTKTMPEDNQHAGDRSMRRPDGTPQHAAASGRHDRYHNVYGMQMVRATREAMREARPERRPFVLTRANYLGGQRYAAAWTGDNVASWAHLRASVPMTLNLGLSGQPFAGPDIGGFMGRGDGRLFARWMGIAAMLPFCRGHSDKGTIDKEPWAMGPRCESTCREALRRRYRFIPYLYTLFREAATAGVPVVRPVFFADPADAALRGEDRAFLLGDDLLVVPRFQSKRLPPVAMPRGVWREIERSADADLPRLYQRGGSILPLGPEMQHTGEKPLDPLTLRVCPDARGVAVGTLYEDAGDGYGFERGEFRLTTFRADVSPGAARVSEERVEGSMPRPARTVAVEVVDDTAAN